MTHALQVLPHAVARFVVGHWVWTVFIFVVLLGVALLPARPVGTSERGTAVTDLPPEPAEERIRLTADEEVQRIMTTGRRDLIDQIRGGPDGILPWSDGKIVKMYAELVRQAGESGHPSMQVLEYEWLRRYGTRRVPDPTGVVSVRQRPPS